ncbi:MAG: DUF2157 domain-containing protein [Veillonellaceae bacterium]|jgi:uncharacterized membrane protein|nr:DUF2157 domain-containing protein [Veillonellaceae bacterium]
MNKKAIEWLYQELPELVAKGVLSTDTAKKLHEHYGPLEQSSGKRTFLMVFGIIGVLLVGLGIILLIAHNWSQLTRPSRLAISIGLLLAAQLLAGAVLHFKRDSAIWRESSAVLHVLMIGAAMALVGQTYHLTEDTDAFLLIWTLLSLPLIYLMKSTGAAILYLAGITLWSGHGYGYPEKQFIWVMFFLVMPYWWGLIKSNRYANEAVILSWVVNLCFYFCFAAAAANHLDRFGWLIYSALFSVNYLSGLLWFNSGRKTWQMPFKFIGLTGSLGLVFIMTFHNIWSNLQLNTYAVNAVESMLTVVLLLIFIIGNGLTAKRLGCKNVIFSLAPLIVGAAYLINHFDTSGVGATIIMNIYMLLLSISIISAGSHKNSLGVVNAGMLMMAVLIIARFLDMNFSFVIRGVVFVLLGIGFLITNWLMVRRKAGEHNEK